MTHNHDAATPQKLAESFGFAAAGGEPPAPRRRATPPFSLRLTFEERAQLEAEAGDMPLGAYIRYRLLNMDAAPRRRVKRAVRDRQALAQVLGELGRTRLASNLNQLAKAAHTGSLPVGPDTEAELAEACKAVQDMRRMLMTALGLHEGDAP